MKIYTKFGDQGQTALRAGQVVSKGDLRIEVLGTCDELNSVLGWAAIGCHDPTLRSRLERTQRQLFSLGAALAQSPPAKDTLAPRLDAWTGALESEIDDWTDALPQLTQFILPGGSSVGAGLHLARAVVRRLERVFFRQADLIPDRTGVYLNRLSDWLFVAARFANQQQGVADLVWRETGE